MSATPFAFSLHKPAPRGWVAMLSDGDQEAIVTASDIPSEPLLPLLWAVRLLLLGTSDTRCSLLKKSSPHWLRQGVTRPEPSAEVRPDSPYVQAVGRGASGPPVDPVRQNNCPPNPGRSHRRAKDDR